MTTINWIDNYHEDHMAVLRLLAKLDGNIKEIDMGTKRQHVDMEFKEFADVIKDVIIPHFKQEESGIYARINEVSEKHQNFIKNMLDEHERLYLVFDQYITAADPLEEQAIIEPAKTIIEVLERHIKKEEEAIPILAKKLNIW